MSTQSLIGRSPQLIEREAPKPPAGQSMPQKSTFELIDAIELARRWNLPESWIRSHTRRRTTDELPHLKLGRYVRFLWGSPELERWLKAREEGTHG
jgi:hypothetical protein